MFREHKAFESVPRETIIWQYMSLSKYISLLRESKIYFNRVDNFEDKSECTLTAIDKKIFRYSDDAKQYWERERKRHFISCWVESDHELALMWDTYGKGGVAIKSSVGGLIDSLSVDTEHYQYLARVKYLDDLLDSSQDSGSAINALKVPMSKRKYYKQESEVRLLYTRTETDDHTGILFPVNLVCLIHGVIVYPNAPQFFLDVVNGELKNANIRINAEFSKI